MICFLACLINIFGVRWFGESEFVFSLIKCEFFFAIFKHSTPLSLSAHIDHPRLIPRWFTVTLITTLIITGLVIDLGGGPNHQRLGFHVSPSSCALPQSFPASCISASPSRDVYRRWRAHAMLLLQYWKTPGPLAGANLTPDRPSLDKFLGILSCIVQAAFSFQGIELVAVCVLHHRSSRVPMLVLTKPTGPLLRRRVLVATSQRPSAAYSGASWSSM